MNLPRQAASEVGGWRRGSIHCRRESLNTSTASFWCGCAVQVTDPSFGASSPISAKAGGKGVWIFFARGHRPLLITSDSGCWGRASCTLLLSLSSCTWLQQNVCHPFCELCFRLGSCMGVSLVPTEWVLNSTWSGIARRQEAKAPFD